MKFNKTPTQCKLERLDKKFNKNITVYHIFSYFRLNLLLC